MSTQLRRIAKALRNHSQYPGVTPAKLAKLAGVSKDAVYKRVAELRQEPGRIIYSNYKIVKGQKTMHYRIAA